MSQSDDVPYEAERFGVFDPIPAVPLSFRDQCAIAFLNGITSAADAFIMNKERIATSAFDFADAMANERQKRGPYPHG